MLRIEHLTKKYGDKTAVDDLNYIYNRGKSMDLSDIMEPEKQPH